MLVGGEHGAEAGDVLAVEVDDRGGDPAVAEAHPPAALAHVLTRPPRVDRLLEQGDARLGPQPLAEEQRRVGGGRERRPGDGLGDVVGVGELVGRHLQVHLEAGVARLRHHRVLAHAQLVGALDVQLVVVLAAQAHQRFVEGEVARVRHHVVHREVALADRRQRAGEHDVQAGGLGRGVADGEELVELGVHAREAVAAELLGIEVELEVEGADLGGVGLAGERGEHGQRARCRLPRRVDEEHLLLGADAPHVGLEHLGAQHRLQRLQVAQHPADGGVAIGRAAGGLVAHQLPASSSR